MSGREIDDRQLRNAVVSDAGTLTKQLSSHEHELEHSAIPSVGPSVTVEDVQGADAAYLKLFGGVDSDTTLQFNDGTTKELHRDVLCRSNYFLKNLPRDTNDTNTATENLRFVFPVGVSAGGMLLALKWIYTGTIEIDGGAVKDVLKAAELLELTALINHCRLRSSWMTGILTAIQATEPQAPAKKRRRMAIPQSHRRMVKWTHLNSNDIDDIVNMSGGILRILSRDIKHGGKVCTGDHLLTELRHDTGMRHAIEKVDGRNPDLESLLKLIDRLQQLADPHGTVCTTDPDGAFAMRKKLFESEEFGDVTISITTEDGKPLHSKKLHRYVLQSCEYFNRRMAFGEATKSVLTLRVLESMSVRAVLLALEWVYTGRIDIDGNELMGEIIATAEYLALAALEKKCLQHTTPHS
jgi:hypothetical protein